MPYIAKMNHNFFDEIDTEEKAYTLGFFLADGTISKRSEKQRRYRLRIGIRDYDKDVLEKIAKAVEYDPEWNKGLYFRKNNGINNNLMVGLYLSSRGLWKSLNAMGYTKPKYQHGPPADLPRALQRHLLRGLIDGDGSVQCNIKDARYPSGINHRQIAVIFYTPSYEMIMFAKKLMNGYSHKRNKVTVSQSENGMAFYQVQYTGSSAYRVCKKLYENASIYLNRKQKAYRKMRKFYRQHVETARESASLREKLGMQKVQSDLHSNVQRAGCPQG